MQEQICGGRYLRCHCKGQSQRSRSKVFIQYLSRSMAKPTERPVCPAKTQISLGIRPVWSESLLSAWRSLRSLAILRAHSKDSDQTGHLPSLIGVFARHTGNFLGFVMWWLIYVHDLETLYTKHEWMKKGQYAMLIRYPLQSIKKTNIKNTKAIQNG